MQGAGLGIAAAALVLVAAPASRNFRPLPTLVLAAALATFCMLVFIVGLGLPFPALGPGCGARRMDILANLATGFATALQPLNLVYCFLGVLLGTLVGVLPGLGPVATIAMLLPATFALPAESALIMLAGIYYGAQYGGSTTAILINLPGESSSVVTALDGYRMAQQGRAGRGAGDRRHRLVLRRHGGDVRHRLRLPRRCRRWPCGSSRRSISR